MALDLDDLERRAKGAKHIARDGPTVYLNWKPDILALVARVRELEKEVRQMERTLSRLNDTATKTNRDLRETLASVAFKCPDCGEWTENAAGWSIHDPINKRRCYECHRTRDDDARHEAQMRRGE